MRLQVIDSCLDKKEALVSFCSNKGIDLENVVFIGNDLNDYEVMSIVGLAVAPADAHQKIKELANYVTKTKGGNGVIKEFAEWLIDDKDV